MTELPKNESCYGVFYKDNEKYIITFNVVSNQYSLYRDTKRGLCGAGKGSAPLELLKRLESD